MFDVYMCMCVPKRKSKKENLFNLLITWIIYAAAIMSIAIICID